MALLTNKLRRTWQQIYAQYTIDNDYCNYCKRREVTIRCMACEVPGYCSAKCTDKDMDKRHQRHCMEILRLNELLKFKRRRELIVLKLKDKLAFFVISPRSVHV